MKRILIVSLFILPLTACSFGKKTTPTLRMRPPAVSEKAAEAKPPAVGDLIVAHWAGNTWSEGKVDSVNGPRARLFGATTLSPSEVDFVDIYQMPKAGASATVKTGDYVITKRSPARIGKARR